MENLTTVLNTVLYYIEETLKMRSNLSDNLSAFSEQVAGHKDQILHDQNGHLLKNFIQQEYSFYVMLMNAKKNSYNFPFNYFPKFYGAVTIKTDKNIPESYIVLQDLTDGLESPCICDLKMGGNSSGTDPHAGIIKHFKQYFVKAISTSGSLFFRMEGMKSWRLDNTCIMKTKTKCKLMSQNQLIESLAQYLFNGHNLRVDVINIFIEKINVLIEWSSQQKQLLLLSSSVLLIYDAKSSFADVKLIDFAHSFVRCVDPQRNVEYTEGLINLKLILEYITDHFKPKLYHTSTELTQITDDTPLYPPTETEYLIS